MKAYTYTCNKATNTIVMLAFLIAAFGTPNQSLAYTDINRCLTFNGTSSGVNFTNNNMGINGTNKLTVAAWVKWENKAVSGQWANMVTLNKNTSSGDDGQFWLQHNNSNTAFEFAVKTTNSRNVAIGTTNPVAGTWYFVVGVYDGSFVSIWVNGIKETQTALSGNIVNYQSNFKLNFGQWAFTGNQFRRFNGQIDEISIWKSALSQNQIRDIMCKQLQGNETNLAGCWRMNETSGTSVYDLTSNARTGTAVSTVIKLSGAPVGNVAIYTYAGSALSLANSIYHDSITVNNFSSVPTAIFVYRVDTAPSVLTPPSGYASLVQNYYFGVFLVNPSGQTYKINWKYDGHPGLISPALTGLCVKRENDSLTWFDLAASDTGNSVFAKAGQSGRNEYILGIKNGPLPVELFQYTAECDEGKTRISWTTATEANNDYFTIEHSTDLAYFIPVAVIQGQGNSNSLINYTWIDETGPTQTTYYRLKQTDFDGTTKIYEALSSNCSADATDKPAINFVSRYNNEAILISLTIPGINSFNVSVTDISGRVLFNKMITPDAGKQDLIIPWNQRGVFMISLVGAVSMDTKKLIW